MLASPAAEARRKSRLEKVFMEVRRSKHGRRELRMQILDGGSVWKNAVIPGFSKEPLFFWDVRRNYGMNGIIGENVGFSIPLIP